MKMIDDCLCGCGLLNGISDSVDGCLKIQSFDHKGYIVAFMTITNKKLSMKFITHIKNRHPQYIDLIEKYEVLL